MFLCSIFRSRLSQIRTDSRKRNAVLQTTNMHLCSTTLWCFMTIFALSLIKRNGKFEPLHRKKRLWSPYSCNRLWDRACTGETDCCSQRPNAIPLLETGELHSIPPKKIRLGWKSHEPDFKGYQNVLSRKERIFSKKSRLYSWTTCHLCRSFLHKFNLLLIRTIHLRRNFLHKWER